MSQTDSIMQLQQEAKERVCRMQERSRRLIQEHPVNLYHGITYAPPSVKPPPPPISTAKPSPCPEKPAIPGKNPFAGLLGGDNEEALLLMLAVILASNDAPLELVLALLYIAL